jgi:hypothetical protein
LSTDPEKNPTFANWTKVFLPYCDGMLHQGYKTASVSYKGTQLFFKGSRITKQNFDWIDKKFGLYTKGRVVITGMSAGAIATFLWADELQKSIKHTAV